MQVLSSALWGGGLKVAKNFVNWQVPLTYRSAQPVEWMREQIVGSGYPTDDTIGLQTAANIQQASIHEEQGDEFILFCLATAGVGNTARAGRLRETFSSYQCGTINLFLFIDGKLTPSAMVNGLIIATEAKAAALQDLRILDEKSEFATGTTTDALVLAVSQRNNNDNAVHQFAGAATTIGNAIGRLVYQCLVEILTLPSRKR
jgi:adenosylcobinamide hydrolase